MNYKWKFFEEIIYNTLILTVVFAKHDFYTDMLITGLAILHSTYRCIDKTLINETCDRKAILVLFEAGIYTGYEVMACKRYISEPTLEFGLKALAIVPPMMLTAYKNCKPQNQAINTPQVIPHTIETINLEIPRPEADDAAESINHTVRPLP
jgi:hypothetical protein